MKNQPKKTTSILSVILYLLSIAFFAYGIYMVVYSTDYVQSYQSTTSVATENAVQYVITSSIAYFGFSIVIFIGALILGKINNLQNNIYRAIASASKADIEDKDNMNDGEQLIIPPEDIVDEKNVNPYYVEPKADAYHPDNYDEPSKKTKKELKAEKKAAKLREKEELAAQKVAAAERFRQEQEAAAAEQLRQEQEAAAAERLRQEQETAAAERLRQEQEAAAAERLRQEQEAAAAEQLRQEQEAAAAEQLRQEQETITAEQLRQERQAADVVDPLRRKREKVVVQQFRKEQEAVDAERARKEVEAIKAERAKRKEKAVKAEKASTIVEALPQESDDIEIETFTLEDISKSDK